MYLPIEVGPLTRTDTEIRQQICKGTGRLLVVDDLDLVVEFASDFLRQAGYQVLTANSAMRCRCAGSRGNSRSCSAQVIG